MAAVFEFRLLLHIVLLCIRFGRHFGTFLTPLAVVLAFRIVWFVDSSVFVSRGSSIESHPVKVTTR